MSTTKYIAMSIQPGIMQVQTDAGTEERELTLPYGCVGIMFVFDSKTSLHQCCGTDCEYATMEEV